MEKYDNINNLGDFRRETEWFDDSTPIIVGAWNGEVDTYAVADHIVSAESEDIVNDFFGTLGKMDKRLFDKDLEGKDVLYLGTRFSHKIHNEDIDLGESTPNTPIELLNGEGGNPYMFWERNNFNKFNETFELRVTGQYIVSYHIPSKTLDVRGTNNQHFSGHIEGIQDFFKAVEACGINKQWVI